MIYRTSLRCGAELHILIASSEAELEAMVLHKTQSLLVPNGHEVAREDGTAVFIIDEVIHPLVWNRAGTRVQHRRMLTMTRMGKGVVHSGEVCKVWKSLD